MMTERHATSRRGFLKRSTGILAASAAVGGALARTAHAAGSDQIKIALIGCGGRGVGAAHNCLDVRDNIKLVAVADAFEDNARRAAESLKKAYGDKVDVPAERVFSGFDAYQKAIRAGVDLVLLVTPPGFRPLHYRAAVEAGKHVFMEKPVCVDAPGFRSVQETNRLAEQKGLKIAVGLNMRHTPSYRETVRRMQDGAVGPLSFLRCYGNNAGVWVRPRKPEQTEMEYQMRNWYYFVWLSGDLIVEQTVHMIDAANWAKGAFPGRGPRHGRPAGPHGQGPRPDLRSLRRRVHVRRRDEALLPGPPHPRLLQLRRDGRARSAGRGLCFGNDHRQACAGTTPGRRSAGTRRSTWT